MQSRFPAVEYVQQFKLSKAVLQPWGVSMRPSSVCAEPVCHNSFHPDMDGPSTLMLFVQLVVWVFVHGTFLLAFLIVSFSRPR